VTVFRFVGQSGYYYDLDLVQYYIRARHYDPQLGRFLTKDPLVLTADNLNRYRYAYCNPLKWTDPSGQRCLIGVHCYKASTEIPGSASGVLRHCGFTVTDDSGTYWIDGQWKNGLTIRDNRHPRPEVDPVEHPQVPFPDWFCKCLKQYVTVFNAKRIAYDATCKDSNWALKCMAEHCYLKIDWPDSGPPIGWRCKECIKWETINLGIEGCMLVCVKDRPALCP
jgi:RHS repeat-associated protein